MSVCVCVCVWQGTPKSRGDAGGSLTTAALQVHHIAHQMYWYCTETFECKTWTGGIWVVPVGFIVFEFGGIQMWIGFTETTGYTVRYESSAHL